MLSGRQRRKASITEILVLPTSEIQAWAGKTGASAVKMPDDGGNGRGRYNQIRIGDAVFIDDGGSPVNHAAFQRTLQVVAVGVDAGNGTDESLFLEV